MLKRRIKKLSKSMVSKITGRHVLVCRECNNEELEVGGDIASVVCSYCVQKWIAAPVNYTKKEKSDKPRGWHFKAFFEHNGIAYTKGEEVTDANEIAQLRKLHGKSTNTKKVTKKTTERKPPTGTKIKSNRGRKNARITK